MESIDATWIIPAAPLLAAGLIALVGLGRPRLAAALSVGAVGVSFLLSLGIAVRLFAGGAGGAAVSTVEWLRAGDVVVEAGTLVDPLGVVMLLVVTFVGLLIHVYSIGYMKGDPGFPRYFAFLSIFIFSMLGIVLASNFVMIFFFWELVGMSSYLLIGFWYEKPAASNAGKKAFGVNRVGDVGLILGILVIYFAAGTFDFLEINHAVEAGELGGPVLFAAALLVFTGAVAKSAQFPLHVWLPDAMEGPTPVSALIHAATMVAAGVYLVARTFPLFHSAPAAMEVVAWIGGITALLMAVVAIVQNDIKKILAYSTLSQLGYMIMAMGLGALTAGMFHLVTHACFKALLFLGAGSIIHALGTQDIREMGGLMRPMRITAWTFIVGTLALAGVPPFAGFFSKDEIIAAAVAEPPLFVLALVSAFLTALYMTRCVVIALPGRNQGGGHPHESPPVMTVPLVILAFLSIVVGWIGAGSPPFGTGSFAGLFGVEGAEGHHAMGAMVPILSTLAAFSGIAAGYLFYGREGRLRTAAAARLAGVRGVLEAKYYIDDLYDGFVARVQQPVAALCARFDRSVLIRTLIDGLSGASRGGADRLRRAQTGRVHTSLLVLAGGISMLLAWILYG
jgi:NADH-quinone oxidoreductase subunit L